MPRVYAPGHPDCWIDCEDSGNAVYITPPGVCLTQCGEESLVSKLVEVARLSKLVEVLQLSIPPGPLPHIAIRGKTDRIRLKFLEREFNQAFEDDTTYEELFGPLSYVIDRINSYPDANGFTYHYSGIRSAFSEGIAENLEPRADGAL